MVQSSEPFQQFRWDVVFHTERYFEIDLRITADCLTPPKKGVAEASNALLVRVRGAR
jgi:hypothetical protein